MTGELKLFKKIWFERGQWSQVNDEPIDNPHPWNFAHILPKGKYPRFRLLEANVWIMTKDQHDSWDNERKSLRSVLIWSKVFELEKGLLTLYNSTYPHH